MLLHPASTPRRRVSSAELNSELASSLDISKGNGMIHDLPPMKPRTPIYRESHNSSLGSLDTLPAELLFIILQSLDFQSLSRFSRTSLKAEHSVEALPAYAQLLQYAPQVLVALAKTKLIRYHSAGLLRQTLCSDRCISCFSFAGFLFLPTCERACFECLDRNFALRVTTVRNAKECFRLTEDHLKRIPIMRSIPGEYQISHWISYRRVFRLVSLQHVRQLALEVHGSAEKVAQFKPAPPSSRSRQLLKALLFREFHEARMEFPGVDLHRIKDVDPSSDDFGGLASMHMPCLGRDGDVDSGQICRDCSLVQCLKTMRPVPGPFLFRFVHPGMESVEVNMVIRAQSNRMYSKEGFADHVKGCLCKKVSLDGRKWPGVTFV